MNLYTVLPDFDTTGFSNVLPSLERSQVSVSDLLSLEAPDVARRAQIPVREVTRLVNAILQVLHAQYGFLGSAQEGAQHAELASNASSAPPTLRRSGPELAANWHTISTLDASLDHALNGGIPLGYLTEVTGESGAGKTQFVLTLLLSIQLPPAHGGLGRNALYVTTEAPLQTSRLKQLTLAHPFLSSIDTAHRPSLSRVLSISTPDLESQEHILHYQVPVAISKHNIGLLVIDSITANYRAEFDRNSKDNDGAAGKRSGAASMAKRTAQLMAMGNLLRDLARRYNIAVVVANQVADRFCPDYRAIGTAMASQQPAPSSHPAAASGRSTAESPTDISHPATQPNAPSMSTQGRQPRPYDPLVLNHQQNFFTGWGDLLGPLDQHNLKTPSLGLVWSNEIAARIALTKTEGIERITAGDGAWDRNAETGLGSKTRWRRHFKVVFAAWAAASEGRGVEFEIGKGGMAAVRHGDERGEMISKKALSKEVLEGPHV